MRKTFFFLIAATVLMIFACGTGNRVTVENFSPEGEVDKLTTFTIEFSHPLAPPDIQGQWLDDAFIKFEPAIRGKFKWVSDNTLIFSPDYPLEPIQEYTAEITDKVLFKTGLSSDFDIYEFHTPEFDLAEVEFFWTHIPNEFYKLSVQGNLRFNYPVSPDELKKFLTVERGGKQVKDYSIVSIEASDVIAINFGEVQQTKLEQELEVTVKEGLYSTIGRKPLADTRTFTEKLPPITRLAITGVSSGFDGETGWIEVGTTQKVIEDKLKNYVSLDPKKKMTFYVNENSFRIETDLSDVRTFTLKIKKGLPGLYGGDLEFNFEQTVAMADVRPSINFADKTGKYLMLGGKHNLEVKAVNLEGADIEVWQVFENNLLFFLDRWDYTYDRHNWSYNPSIHPGNTGKMLYRDTVELSNKQNWIESFTVNLDSVLQFEKKGIYVVKTRSSKDRWIDDSKIVAISDLALIAKKSRNQILVFVNSISKAEPVADVDVTVVSTNNQTLLKGKTDMYGAIMFTDVEKKTEGFDPRLILVRNGKDFNYIDLYETEIETSRFDVGGQKELSEDYKCFVYSDRNLYRPGETVYLSAIVRSADYSIARDLPIILKLTSPTGRTVEEYRLNLNEQGSFDLKMDMPKFSSTGEYTAQVYSGDEEVIGSYKFSLEDFVPDKLRVLLKKDKEKVFPGETVSIDINSEFLFGAKASGMKYEVNVNMAPRDYVSKKYKDYDFGNAVVKSKKAVAGDEAATEEEIMDMLASLDIDVSKDKISKKDLMLFKKKFEEKYGMNGKLDEDGHAIFKYIVPHNISCHGYFDASAYVSVFDFTGRTVNRNIGFEVYPRKYFVGIKKDGYYFGVNKKINFKLAAVNYNDKPISFDGTAKLVRFQWQTVLKKNWNNKFYYDSELKEIVEWEKSVRINKGTKNFTFTVPTSGRYELRIYKDGSDDYSFAKFYAYGWAARTASSFEVDKEGKIDIVADKEKYEPGDKAKILFMCPFSGKMLVTVERNGVYDYKYIDVEEKSAELEIPITDEHLPNVYVTATLFKKHSMKRGTPFLVGHGFKPVLIEKKYNKLPVTIKAPDKIKPNTVQKITVKTAPDRDIYITLAAVDEGILQIKDFQTPDPYGYMYAKQPLKTQSYDLYELLLPEIVKMGGTPGGGDGYLMEKAAKKRTNPITTKRFKLFAYWSGIRRTNSAGEVEVSVKVPQFNGEVRLMAVAYTDERFGSAEKPMKVADDIIIEPEVPRVLSMNDELTCPVTLVNTTNKKGRVKIRLKVDGPLEVSSAGSQSVEVPAKSTATALFGIKAKSDIGKAKIVFETSGMAKIKEEIDIAVRPVSPLVKESGAGNVNGGKDVKFRVPSDFIAGTQETKLTISKFPAVKFAKHLKYLVGYPHGCIEQTVSRLFPQIYFEEIAKIVAPDLYKTRNPAYYVKEGIRKIETMQLYDGSMAYWQGRDRPSWWGSVYAAHFLIEARKAGFDVNDKTYDNLLRYLKKQLNEISGDKATYNYSVYYGNSRRIKKIARKEIIYSLYVLALSGRPDISLMNYYKNRPHLLSNDTKYLLAGAFALKGQWSSYYAMLPKSYKPERTDRYTGGNFDSEIRANAIMLNVLMEVEPNNRQIPEMIRYLTRNSGKMYSTQERSFAFLALGKAAKRTAGSNVKVKVKAGGKTLGTFIGKDLTIDKAALNGASVTLETSGKGEVYYFWETEGIKKGEQIAESDMNLKIRREYYDYNTMRKISDNKFTQGQLIICKLSLTGMERSADNIVISDLVPAGFEIENPRLKTSAALNIEAKYPLKPDYMDVRDDRLILFTGLRSRISQDFYYMLRVVNRGKFRLPPVSADAMYDPDYHSVSGFEIVEVSKM